MLRLTASQLREVERKASRWRKDPARRYRSVRDSLVAKVREAFARR